MRKKILQTFLYQNVNQQIALVDYSLTLGLSLIKVAKYPLYKYQLFLIIKSFFLFFAERNVFISEKSPNKQSVVY